jgi:hypothetical protein
MARVLEQTQLRINDLILTASEPVIVVYNEDLQRE